MEHCNQLEGCNSVTFMKGYGCFFQDRCVVPQAQGGPDFVANVHDWIRFTYYKTDCREDGGVDLEPKVGATADWVTWTPLETLFEHPAADQGTQASAAWSADR